MRGNFDNTFRLVRFILRRERIMSTAWIVGMALFSRVEASATISMFDDVARQNFAATLNNPVMVAMMGPVYGAENYTPGAMYSGMMLLWMVIAAAVMNVFLVVRHTRADEEKGREEVVRSLPTGRLANLNAAMISALIINALLALCAGLATASAGIESMDFAGSMLYGAVLGALGLCFAAITAVFCQLSSSAGGASGLSFLTLGAAYMMRAAGDMYGMEALSCLSPLGLAQRSQVYIENNLWPVLLLLAEAAVISVIAYRLNAMRDIDRGFIPARPGRAGGSAALLSSFGLSFRLLRNTLTVWLAVMFLLGASYGSIIGDIYNFIGDSPDYLLLIGIPQALLDTLSSDEIAKIVSGYFGAFVTSMISLICIIPLLSAIMKARGEEKDGRAEHLLSRAVTRGKYLAGYAAIAYGASVLFQCAAAAGLYGTVAANGSSAAPFGDILKEHLAYLPALWVMIGAAILMIGLLPKASVAVWGYFGFIFFASFIGEMFGLPEWMSKLSPLSYIPKTSLEELKFAPLAALTAIAAVFTAIGFIFYRRRDVSA